VQSIADKSKSRVTDDRNLEIAGRAAYRFGRRVTQLLV